jgi:hypothetical protein
MPVTNRNPAVPTNRAIMAPHVPLILNPTSTRKIPDSMILPTREMSSKVTGDSPPIKINRRYSTNMIALPLLIDERA